MATAGGKDFEISKSGAMEIPTPEFPRTVSSSVILALRRAGFNGGIVPTGMRSP
jgi:hypothetical protein